MDTIYITGHKNPDTDSIISAMAYAALKNALGLREYKAARLGEISDETRTVLERAGRVIDAVSLHYYTLPHQDWQHKGSATDFTGEEYYTTLHKTLRMEELVENHSRIIKQFAGGRSISGWSPQTRMTSRSENIRFSRPAGRAMVTVPVTSSHSSVPSLRICPSSTDSRLYTGIFWTRGFRTAVMS